MQSKFVETTEVDGAVERPIDSRITLMQDVESSDIEITVPRRPPGAFLWVVLGVVLITTCYGVTAGLHDLLVNHVGMSPFGKFFAVSGLTILPIVEFTLIFATLKSFNRSQVLAFDGSNFRVIQAALFGTKTTVYAVESISGFVIVKDPLGLTQSELIMTLKSPSADKIELCEQLTESEKSWLVSILRIKLIDARLIHS